MIQITPAKTIHINRGVVVSSNDPTGAPVGSKLHPIGRSGISAREQLE
ncbi:MAG: hypothetical protein IH586_03565 [Anaerolineaceae bacterium]|nr:hypothetical protein [Anaerolineaceae bacterium]